MRQARLLERLQLSEIMDDDLQALLCRLGQPFRAEHAFEQHDRGANAGTAQRQSLLESCHRKRVGIRQAEGGGHEAMAVGNWP